jgi:hypothetical protein
MNRREQEQPARVTVTAHPPERGRGGAPVILPCACCCCCCCCLHTLGGLVGAVAGTLQKVKPRPRRIDPDAPFPFRRDVFEDEDGPLVPAALLYWLLVGMLVALLAVGWYARNFLRTGFGNPNDLAIGLFVALMVLPSLQLAASGLSAAIIAVFYPERRVSLARIGKITLWSFVGMMAGAVALAGCCGVFSFMR